MAHDTTEIDLVALRRRYSFLFPNGSRHVVEPFRGPGQALLLKYRETPSDNIRERFLLAKQLMEAAVPTASQDDLDSLAIEDWAHIIAAANGATAMLEDVRKNEFSDGAASESEAVADPS